MKVINASVLSPEDVKLNVHSMFDCKASFAFLISNMVCK